jgi:nucleotide-binding universal stress UspA family protein
MTGKEAMPKMNESIVCGIDNSYVSRSAARVAARLARELGYKLILAHVADDPPAFPYGDARLRELKRRDATAEGIAMLEGVAATLADIEPESRVLLGDPVKALAHVTQSEKTELLVVGSRSRGPLAAAVLGSVSSRLTRVAGCPVVVVRSAVAAHRFLAGTPGGRVVCAVDGSNTSRRALRLAAGLAEHMELELMPMPIEPNGTRPDVPAEASAPRLKAFGDGKRAVPTDASAIVVGSHERGPWHAAALGSLSHELAASAPVPVMVVPPTARLPRAAASVADAAVEEMLQQSADRAQQALVNGRRWRGATFEHRRVGRFSQGLEQRPETPSTLRQGRFSEGIERRPGSVETVRRGSFADGFEDDVPTPRSKAA